LKRFIVFSGDDYYPGGGVLDLRESFDTLEEAKKYVEDSFQVKSEGKDDTVKCCEHGVNIETYSSQGDWAHILDTQEGSKIGLYPPSRFCPQCSTVPEFPAWYEIP